MYLCYQSILNLRQSGIGNEDTYCIRVEELPETEILLENIFQLHEKALIKPIIKSQDIRSIIRYPTNNGCPCAT